jgi:hypothetical protein
MTNYTNLQVDEIVKHLQQFEQGVLPVIALTEACEHW